MGFSMLGAMGDYMAAKSREIVKIQLAKIKEDEKNDFEVMGTPEIEKKNALLKDSIEQFGLLDPLVVRPGGDGNYILVSGHRRKLMHDRLVQEGKNRFNQVECIVISTNEVDAEQILLEANLPNRVISDWEKMQAVKRMNDIFQRREDAGEKVEGRRREHIAEALGMSVSAVGRLEKIEKNLSEQYKQELKDGRIGVSVADKLASKPMEEQEAIHEAMGPKVRLTDLAKVETPQELEPEPEPELKQTQRRQEAKETRIKLQGIDPALGELGIIIIAMEENKEFRAGFYFDTTTDEGEPRHFEYINMQHSFLSYDTAWDVAMNLIRMDPDAKALLDTKEPQGPTGEAIIQPEDNPEDSFEDGLEDTENTDICNSSELVTFDSLQTNNGYVEVKVGHKFCVIESGSLEAGIPIARDNIFLTRNELQRMINVLEAAKNMLDTAE